MICFNKSNSWYVSISVTLSLSHWGLSFSVNSTLLSRILLFYLEYSKILQTIMFTGLFQAPRVGLEPTTTRLTAECSTIELSRIILFSSVCDHNVALQLSYGGLFISLKILYLQKFTQKIQLGQALDRLVTVSSIHYCTSTSALSTLYSSRGLTSFEWDISSWGGLHA